MRRTALAISLFVSVTACRDPNLNGRPPDPPRADAGCGDGFIQADLGEDCEGSDLADATCQTLGFDTGTLACTQECKFATTLCVKRCGNGVLDTGEECDGKLGPLACANWGFKGCTADCKIDANTCGPTAYATAQALQMGYGGVTAISPPSELVAAVPNNFHRIEIFPYSATTGFGNSKKLSFNFNESPAKPLVANLDADGGLDVGAINLDGSIDRYLSGSTYTYQSWPVGDGGLTCAAVAWVGAFGNDAVARCPTKLIVFKAGAYGPPSELNAAGIASAAVAGDQIFWVDGTTAEVKVYLRGATGFTSQTPLPAPFVPLSIAAGDFDADGDFDLAATDATAVHVWENTGNAFAEKTNFSFSNAVGLLVTDLDLDGRADIAWVGSAKAYVKRSQGGFVFAPFDVITSLNANNPISLSAGDLDGDADPDLAATYMTGPDSTATYVLLNKLR